MPGCKPSSFLAEHAVTCISRSLILLLQSTDEFVRRHSVQRSCLLANTSKGLLHFIFNHGQPAQPLPCARDRDIYQHTPTRPCCRSSFASMDESTFGLWCRVCVENVEKWLSKLCVRRRRWKAAAKRRPEGGLLTTNVPHVQFEARQALNPCVGANG